jgi:hypothetical protein
MLNLPGIDTVIVPVRAEPLDPDDLFLEIDRDHEAIVVAPDIEHDTFG